MGWPRCKAAALFLLAVTLSPAAEVIVTIETAMGNIDVAVDTTRAPRTSANFLRYVDAGLYDGGSFHRTVKLDNQPDNPIRIEVTQAAADPSRSDAFFPPIALERTSVTGLRHRDGVISMARGGPDTARENIFICIGDQPELDFGGKRNPDGQGFAAFGRVVRGMDTVKRVQYAPAEKQRLDPPVRITRIRRKH